MTMNHHTVAPFARVERFHARAPHARHRLWHACVLACLTSASLPSFGAPLTLATAPPGSGGREPAPNVIVSVDDSGSMGWDVNGCATADWNLSVYGSYSNMPGATGCPTLPALSTNPSRIASLRAALTAQFGSTTKIPDNRIRLAWQAMWNNGGASGAGSLTAGATNSMKPFSGSHRTNFATFVSSLRAANGTPSHKMMQQAYDYMRSPEGTNSPWADTPGVAQATPYLACRRSYHIFMTDGAWNSEGSPTTGNKDGTAITLPDGVAYAPATSNQVKAYKDVNGGTKGTLSDFAFKNWATDLQDGTGGTQDMANTIPPLMRVKANEPVGATTLTPYWNPKNDPATWQHLTQHTIGFGNSASTWTGNPTWDNVTDNNYAGGYSALVNGTVTWQDPMPSAAENTIRPSELWHMALNGRGKFYPARTPAALDAAFSEILNNILTDTTPASVSIGANSTTTRTVSTAYVAGYDASLGWAGTLNAFPLSKTGVMGTTASWMAAGKIGTVGQGLDATAFSETARVVMSHDGSGGISFEWANLAPGQKTQLKFGTDTDTVGQNRLKFVRGEKTNELAAGGAFRDRVSRLGDIVGSNIWYVSKPSGDYVGSAYSSFRTTNYSRTPMVYVGANDGMLHGFDAATGAERIAYVPKGVLGKFINYSNPSYTHEYFVDHQPASGDADVGSSTWKTVLFGGLGGGGKGYYILDITNPGPSSFAAVNASSIVMADTTGGSDPDIGHIYSPPVIADGSPEKSKQIVKMNNGKWAVVMGNGYNSTNERPVLVIHYLDGTAARIITPTCASTCPGFIGDGNGLSSPRLLDLNSDGTVDVAYAGDLKGNLWKFDLTSATASDWGVAYSNTPYFVAKNPSNVRQPITTAPFALPHPLGGLMLAFGTGRNITTDDPGATRSTDIDTMWGIWDNMTLSQTAGIVTMTDSTLGTVNLGTDATRPATLVQQTAATAVLDTDGKEFNDVSTNSVVFTRTASTNRGWYLDWPHGGERVLQNPLGFGSDRVLVFSGIPPSNTAATGETCSPTTAPAKAYISVFNLFNGNPSATPVFSALDPGMAMGSKAHVEVAPGDRTMIIGPDVLRLVGASDGAAGAVKLRPGSGGGIRSNWREYQ